MLAPDISYQIQGVKQQLSRRRAGGLTSAPAEYFTAARRNLPALRSHADSERAAEGIGSTYAKDRAALDKTNQEIHDLHRD